MFSILFLSGEEKQIAKLYVPYDPIKFWKYNCGSRYIYVNKHAQIWKDTNWRNEQSPVVGSTVGIFISSILSLFCILINELLLLL